MLPVEPKLGKMLIFGAIFNCLDPILTIVSGLSVRDPFLTPFDKKDVSNSFLELQFELPLVMHSKIFVFLMQ
jgi:ATP-dependent RNA helicase DHX36